MIFPTDDFLSKSPTNYISIYTVFLTALRLAPKYAILVQFRNLLTLRCLWAKDCISPFLSHLLPCERCLIEAQYLTFRNTIP